MVKQDALGDHPSENVNALEWNGKDDPENPRNFTLRRRIASTAAVTFLAFVSTLAGSLISPSQSEIANAFNVSGEVSVLPLALYNAGLAFGPSFGAPLCETFGRKIVFLTTTPMFALFILGAGFSQSAASLVTCRFFAGVFASPAVSNASATIVDYTAGRYRAISLAFYYSIPFCGAVIGPLIGGFIVDSKGWRWTQWTTLFFIVAFYIPVVFTKETYKKTILQRRAKRLGLPYPSPNCSIAEAIQHFSTTLLIRPIHMMLTEPIVTLVCLYNGFMFGLMYTFVTASGWVYQTYYGFDLKGQSLSFLGLITGSALAPFLLVFIDLNVYQPRLRRWKASHECTNSRAPDRFPPENRLFPAMTASFLLPASLFVFAWTTRPTVHWMVPITFQGITQCSSVLIYASSSTFMLDAYGPLYGASAAGAAMLSRYSLSTAFPLFALPMYRDLGVGKATTSLASATLAMAPIPWLFWKYGQGLRGKTKYETSA